MRRWTRARWECRCGLCGAGIRPGDVFLELRVQNVKAIVRRCAECEGPAPPDLPFEIERQEPVRLDMTRLGFLPLESLREREPGEEG